MLSEELQNKISYNVERIRDIGEFIQQNTNVRKELIPNMANIIFLKLVMDNEF